MSLVLFSLDLQFHIIEAFSEAFKGRSQCYQWTTIAVDDFCRTNEATRYSVPVYRKNWQCAPMIMFYHTPIRPNALVHHTCMHQWPSSYADAGCKYASIKNTDDDH